MCLYIACVCVLQLFVFCLCLCFARVCVQFALFATLSGEDTGVDDCGNGVAVHGGPEVQSLVTDCSSCLSLPALCSTLTSGNQSAGTSPGMSGSVVGGLDS